MKLFGTKPCFCTFSSGSFLYFFHPFNVSNAEFYALSNGVGIGSIPPIHQKISLFKELPKMD